MTERRIVTAFCTITQPYRVHPPVGCGPENSVQKMTEYQVYTADYYGKGEKVYMRSMARIRDVGGLWGPAFDFCDYGHPEQIAAVLEEYGVSLPD